MRRFSSAATVLALATLFAAVYAQAQAIPQRVNVPFKFNLNDKAFPAAMYYVRYEPSGESVEFLGQGRNVLSRAHVITRLAPSPGAKSSGSVRLVFDQVGEERFLSEVWIPGADGFLLRATSERHKHATVDADAK
jgi:hypothetical protein